MLHFPNQTLPLWTPFRGQVLNYIFKTALGSLGDQLKSAVVSVSSVPDEEDTYALNLTLTVAGGWPTIREVRDEILTKVSEWSTEWSGQQQQDYGRRIYLASSHLSYETDRFLQLGNPSSPGCVVRSGAADGRGSSLLRIAS